MLHRHYPASSLVRASPPPLTAQPVPRGLLVVALTSRRVGFPVLPQVSVARMSSPIPRRYGRSALFVRFLRPVSLPRVSIGSAFALPFSRLARCSLILGPARSLTRLHEPLTSGASPAAVTSDTRPDCFRRNESCRVGFSLPRESCSVFTAHSNVGLLSHVPTGQRLGQISRAFSRIKS